MAALVHLGGEQAGDEGLAHAALAGHDADHMLDVGALVGRQGGRAGLGGAVAAAGDAAAGALVGTFFCHDSFFLPHLRQIAFGPLARWQTALPYRSNTKLEL